MASENFAPVLAALSTLSSNDRNQKTQAHNFLERFQKSVGGTLLLCMKPIKWKTNWYKFQPEAWKTTHSMLSASDTSVEAKLFAATTLKGKVGFKQTFVRDLPCTHADR